MVPSVSTVQRGKPFSRCAPGTSHSWRSQVRPPSCDRCTNTRLPPSSTVESSRNGCAETSRPAACASSARSAGASSNPTPPAATSVPSGIRPAKRSYRSRGELPGQLNGMLMSSGAAGVNVAPPSLEVTTVQSPNP